ncbi:MAG: Ig-like domain-containing protein [Acidobacteriota bacterium]
MVDKTSRQKVDRDWYSVSVESMRRTLVLLVSVVALIGAAFAYQHWEHVRLGEEAEREIEKATELTRQFEDRADYAQIRREFYGAWEDLAAAREALADERFGDALTRGRRSLLEFERVLQRDEGEIENRGRFLSVSGNVEYRRGERGAWKRARYEDVIYFGDWVKTSAAGSARILFPDGSEFTLRSNTMVHLISRTNRFGRSEKVAELPFGWVELTTDDTASTVRTPRSQAEVRQGSAALVAFDRERNTARVAAFGGSVEVTAENGQQQVLGALQQVVQVGDLLSAPTALPNRPRPLSPSDERTVALSAAELRLSWRPVDGAATYHLQISRTPLFASTIIDDTGRTSSSARVGLRGEGVFYWQVAAVDAQGLRGPWSVPRSFQVAQPQRGDDDTPPPLRVEDVQSYGRLTIVNGRTEPGATVTVDEQAAQVAPDGSFSITLQMDREGFGFVEIVATDAAGNTSQEQRRVFVDTSY